MLLVTTIDISSIDPQTAAVVGTAIGVVVLLGLRHHYGYIPSFWCARRLILPLLADIGRGDGDVADVIPEKTRLPL